MRGRGHQIAAIEKRVCRILNLHHLQPYGVSVGKQQVQPGKQLAFTRQDFQPGTLLEGFQVLFQKTGTVFLRRTERPLPMAVLNVVSRIGKGQLQRLAIPLSCASHMIEVAVRQNHIRDVFGLQTMLLQGLLQGEPLIVKPIDFLQLLRELVAGSGINQESCDPRKESAAPSSTSRCGFSRRSAFSWLHNGLGHHSKHGAAVEPKTASLEQVN